MSQRSGLRAFFAVVCAALIGVIVAACGSSSSSLNQTGQQQIKHVFVITLENENYATTFGANSKAPYLSQTLASQGAMVQQYYGTGHVSLDNYISMISGQAPTPETDNDCSIYQDYKLTGTTPDGQAIGSGCVYPASIKTLPDQLTAAGLTWKGYEGDMGNDPTREAATCGHPTLNTTDLTQSGRSAERGRAAGRSVRDASQPVHVFPLDHRFAELRPERREPEQTRDRSAIDLNHRQLQPDYTEPVRRWPRLAVRERPAGRTGQRQYVPAEVGADYHRLAGVPAGRSVDHQLRRKQLRHRDAVCVRREI